MDYVGKAEISAETIGKIQKAGGKATAGEADVSVSADVNNLLEKTIAAYGQLDILVNNAGIEKKIAFMDYP